jgi:hypothetical protein
VRWSVENRSTLLARLQNMTAERDYYQEHRDGLEARLAEAETLLKQIAYPTNDYPSSHSQRIARAYFDPKQKFDVFKAHVYDADTDETLTFTSEAEYEAYLRDHQP